MLELAFLSPDLRRFDEAPSELVVLPLFSDVRPLRGAAGLVDWRLCGFLSKLIIRGRVAAQFGEQTLLPGAGRLPFDKVLLFGLGERSAFDVERFDEAMLRIFRALDRLNTRAAALELPGRAVGAIEAALAAERLHSVARRCDALNQLDDLVVVESPAGQRAMEPVIEQERRRSRARL